MIPSHGTHLRAHLHGQSLGWIPYVLVEAVISDKVMVSHVLMTTPKLVKICNHLKLSKNSESDSAPGDVIRSDVDVNTVPYILAVTLHVENKRGAGGH